MIEADALEDVTIRLVDRLTQNPGSDIDVVAAVVSQGRESRLTVAAKVHPGDWFQPDAGIDLHRSEILCPIGILGHHSDLSSFDFENGQHDRRREDRKSTRLNSSH